jgi:hypothetical protein
MLQILNGLKFDFAAAQQFHRAARTLTAGVVVKRHSLHNFVAPDPGLLRAPQAAAQICEASIGGRFEAASRTIEIP